MSPHLHYEIVRIQQSEIAAHTHRAHHAADLRATAGRSRRPINSRVGKALVAVGVSLAGMAAVAVSGAFASQPPAPTGGHISASQLSRDISALQANGYTPYRCTGNGTLMRNSRTGQFKLVSW